MKRDAVLLIVDVQNDFCPGGALGISGCDDIIPTINRYIELFRAQGLTVIASRDWHPPVTRHFKEYGGIWPVHCVQGSEGAAFRKTLLIPPEALVFSKGMDPEQDDYSALHARDDEGTPLPDYLIENGLRHIHICGLATDYCVRQTALEAVRQGFVITVLVDAVAGVDLLPGDSARALAEIIAAGARTVTVAELVRSTQNT